MREFIICSAVNYHGTIVGGRRHKNCHNTIKELLNIENDGLDREDQGFLTSTGRFVDRSIAFKIAKKNNQIVHKMFDDCDTGILTSEDLYGIDD